MDSDERRMKKVFELYLEERKVDPSAVCIFFSYFDSKPGYKLTNSSKRPQHHNTTANNNDQLLQRRYTSEVAQTARRRHRPPAAVLVDQMPRTAKNKRKRMETSSPTNRNPSPTMPAPTTSIPDAATPDIPPTPETARDAAPLYDLTKENISLLSADERDLSDGEEETNSDDQLPANNTDVQSEFFTKNRFSPIACEEEEEEHETNGTDPAPPKQATSDNNFDNNCYACDFHIRRNFPIYRASQRSDCFHCFAHYCKHCLPPKNDKSTVR